MPQRAQEIMNWAQNLRKDSKRGKRRSEPSPHPLVFPPLLDILCFVTNKKNFVSVCLIMGNTLLI